MNAMKEPFERELAVFSAARRLPAAERLAYLNQTCAGDAPLRRRVEELLRASEEEPAAEAQRPERTPATSTVTLSGTPGEKAGDRIGHYKLLQQIGEGGCGMVYMAEQQEPVRRRVALKVIKLGMDTKQVIARFEAERQALAMMDHPNIAKVFDAGATETGRPYFVMELVRGVKITDYCDEHNLSTKERLELFIQVCHAVQHAHQKGIIHRDLKPSNILVASDDGVAVPKVIDFGIAKATQGRLTDQTLFTAFEQFMGTPAYMSPEQAELTMQDVDTRTDIYSLGVLLYELLTAKTPFDPSQLLALGLDAMRRTIREQEPERPSTKLSTMIEGELTTTARHRQTESIKLIHLLRGDLDWIVMKCLEKDRARRYETANGLAKDVQRHLNCEPVVARPPSTLYEFQKTVRRHKFGFAAAGAVTAALMIGLAVSTWLLVNEKAALRRASAARREQARLRELAQAKEQIAVANERKAQKEAARSDQTARFLKEMLRSVGPKVALGRDTTLLKEILDNTAAQVGKDLKDQPEVQADLLFTIGGTYLQLSELEKAEAVEREALRLRKACFGATNRLVAASLNDLARVLNIRRGSEDLAEAEKDAREALRMWRTLTGDGTQEAAFSLYLIASSLSNQGRKGEAETLYRECLAIRRRLFGNDDKDVASTLDNLAMVLLSQGETAEAERMVREALRIQRRVFGPEHPDVADSLIDLARVLQSESRLTEAEAAAREALGMQQKFMAQDHSSVQFSLRILVEVLTARGDFVALEALDRENLARQRSLLGKDSPAVSETLMDLADALAAQGRKSEAEKASAEALDICLSPNGRITAETPPLLMRQAEALHQIGKSQEAEKLFELAVDTTRRKLRETDPILGALHGDFAFFLLYRAGKPGRAAEEYLKAAEIYRPYTNAALIFTYRELGDALLKNGKPAEAQRYLVESLALYRKFNRGEDRWGTAFPNLALGDALEQQHKVSEAEQAYRDAVAAYSKSKAEGDENYVHALSSVVRVLTQENKQGQAEALCRDLLAERRVTITNTSPDLAQMMSALANSIVPQSKPEDRK
jgi:serine/threonine protein kinase/tetratricopeptide (TPR) repeat protein